MVFVFRQKRILHFGIPCLDVEELCRSNRSYAFFGGVASAAPLFCFGGIYMATEKKAPQKISIGNKDSDKELIQRIFKYQQEKGIRYTADAVRSLCEDALAIKNALK